MEKNLTLNGSDKNIKESHLEEARRLLAKYRVIRITDLYVTLERFQNDLYFALLENHHLSRPIRLGLAKKEFKHLEQAFIKMNHYNMIKSIVNLSQIFNKEGLTEHASLALKLAIRSPLVGEPASNFFGRPGLSLLETSIEELKNSSEELSERKNYRHR